MSIVGIDFGGSRIRAAVFENQVATPIALPFFSSRPPFKVEWIGEQDQKASLKWRVTCLKRILDSEKDFDMSQRGKSSLSLFAEILTKLRIESGKLTKDEVSKCVLSLPPCSSQREYADVLRGPAPEQSP